MNEKGYRDPTAELAVGRVMKELEKQERMLKKRDGTAAEERRPVDYREKKRKKRYA